MLFRRRVTSCVRRIALASLLGAIVGTGLARADDADKPLHVFAAASLAGVLDEVAAAFRKRDRGPLRLTYASSSLLARQIERGAPADVYLSANTAWVDYLAKRDLIDRSTRHELLGNALVLIAPAASSAAPVALSKGVDLLNPLDSGRLAMGDPDHVPAGVYGRQALTALGVWRGVERRIARANNVRAALALVARGEAPLGIVYRSDALAERKVKIVGRFPEGSHRPIVFPVAVVKASRQAPRAHRFVAFLKAPARVETYRRHGFRPLD